MFQGSGFCAPPRPGRLQIYLSDPAHGPGPWARLLEPGVHPLRVLPSHVRLRAFEHIGMHVRSGLCMYMYACIYACTCMYVHVHA